MSSGTQVDLDWAGTDGGQSGAGAPAASAPATGASAGEYLTDEEILGIEPIGSGSTRSTRVNPEDARKVPLAEDAGDPGAQRDSSGKDGPRNDSVQGNTASAPMPEWMRAVAADPKSGAEAQQLWREHQEFRAAFSSPEEARAIKELLPDGVKDVLTLREATQSVDRIDAALFSGDTRAQSEVVAELARTNPAAFRSMFAEAAKVLAGMGVNLGVGGRGQVTGNPDGTLTVPLRDGPTLRRDGEGWGTQDQLQLQNQSQSQNQNQNQN